MHTRLIALMGGLFGAAGVILGAFGAHTLRGYLLERGMRDAWETGVQFHLLHSVALMALAAWARADGGVVAGRRLGWVARCWGLGIVFFSGSLYLLSTGAPAWIGPFTPIGGLFLIAGWVLIAASAFSPGQP